MARTCAVALVAVAVVHRADKNSVSALSSIAIAVIAVLASTLSALALLTTALILLTALILITISPSTTPRLPVGRVLRLIECIVHLVTCVVYGSLRRSPKMETMLLGNL
ncbi:MAG TPA: hypothetical protein VG488_04450 [Candidatus Angelobacter sp.]|nr:hypothetical protein [Candidatus Angelobacter sp.]